MGNPENKEAPNSSETHPTKDTTAVVKALGSTAIKGSQSGK